MQYPRDWKTEYSRKPICGVLAVAMVSGVSFDTATAAIVKSMLPHQKRHGGKTYHDQRLGALRKLGVQYLDRVVTDRKNLRFWVQERCKPGVTYMINTSRHVVTVRDGIVCDQGEIKHILEHNSRRCFVRQVTEIV